MSVEALVSEVRRRRTPDEELHLTAIAVLADSDLVPIWGRSDRPGTCWVGGIRAEGATDTFPTVSSPTLRLVRSGVAAHRRDLPDAPRGTTRRTSCASGSWASSARTSAATHRARAPAPLQAQPYRSSTWAIPKALGERRSRGACSSHVPRKPTAGRGLERRRMRRSPDNGSRHGSQEPDRRRSARTASRPCRKTIVAHDHYVDDA